MIVRAEDDLLHLLAAQDVRKPLLIQKDAVEGHLLLSRIDNALDILEYIDRVDVALRPLCICCGDVFLRHAIVDIASHTSFGVVFLSE